MATLSNRTFYQSGNAEASAIVGFESMQNRVVRYNLNLNSGEQASHIKAVFVGDPRDICIEYGSGSGTSLVNGRMSFYFAISTDPDAFANAGYADIASATGKAIFTQVGGYGSEESPKYEVSCDADMLLYPHIQYYLWVFPGFSETGNSTWGWMYWNNVPIEVTLSGHAGIAWIKTATGFKPAVPYVRQSGEWKRSIPYVRKNNAWHIGTGK